MKLVELLARELSEWPAWTEFAAQDSCENWKGRIWFTDNEFSECINGAWDIGEGNVENHIDGIEMSSDCNTSIVTRAQWRNKRIKMNQSAISGCRLISQPQAEEVEVKSFAGKDVKIEYAFAEEGVDTEGPDWKIIGTANADSISCVFDQIDGPIKWRDTIIHCQAIIEDCEREIQRNVDLLDAEGLMMQTDSKKAMQHYAPDVEQKDWQIGDILEITRKDGDNSHDFKIGEHVKIDDFDLDDEDLPVKCNALDDSDYWYIKFNEAKFMRRP